MAIHSSVDAAQKVRKKKSRKTRPQLRPGRRTSSESGTSGLVCLTRKMVEVRTALALKERR